MDYQKITMLDNLPEIIDNSHPQSSIKVGRYNGHEMLPPSEADRFKKFIRDEHEVPSEAGMTPAMNMMTIENRRETIENRRETPSVNYNLIHEDLYKNTNTPSHHQKKILREEDYNSPNYYNNKDIHKKKKKYNCGKISAHIEQCQFCKKLYSSDKNIYILFIIFLFFICFLLFKKILSV